MANQPSGSGATANQRDFAAMFGGATENIDFSVGADATLDFLPIPDPSDDLETTARKLRVLADVVTAGHSLASSPNMKLGAMGLVCPPVNWANGKKAVPPGADSATYYTMCATAMSRIWDQDGITAENAVWLTANMTYAIPLVIAVSEVQTAERELRGGQKELPDMELVEVQTAHRIVAIASHNMDQVYRRLKQIARDINSSKDIIQAREHAIRSKMPNWKPKKRSKRRPRASSKADLQDQE